MNGMMNPTGLKALTERLNDVHALAREHAPAPGQAGELTPGHFKFFVVTVNCLQAMLTEPTNKDGDTWNARVYGVERLLGHTACNLAHLTRDDELATRLYQLLVECHQIAYKLMTEAHSG